MRDSKCNDLTPYGSTIKFGADLVLSLPLKQRPRRLSHGRHRNFDLYVEASIRNSVTRSFSQKNTFVALQRTKSASKRASDIRSLYHPRFQFDGLLFAYKANLSAVFYESFNFFVDTADIYYTRTKKRIRVPQELSPLQKEIFRTLLAVFGYRTKLLAVARRQAAAGIFADRFANEYYNFSLSYRHARALTVNFVGEFLPERKVAGNVCRYVYRVRYLRKIVRR